MILCVIKASCPNGVKLTSEEGIILSPNYPQTYPQNIICRWTISLHKDQTVALYLNDIDLPPRPSEKEPCEGDHLTFTEDGAEDFTKCGQQQRKATTSIGNEITVQFNSDSKPENKRGFNISYTG